MNVWKESNRKHEREIRGFVKKKKMNKKMKKLYLNELK